jgi:Bacteriocin-protection, YdeI or OmpD-Associated
MSGPDKNLAARSIHAMPGFVRKALEKRNLVDAYRDRPTYQQNDYLGWIAQAKLEALKQKRLTQMLDELEKGDVYMEKPWAPPKHD